MLTTLSSWMWADRAVAPAAHLHNFLSRDGMPPVELLAVARSDVLDMARRSSPRRCGTRAAMPRIQARSAGQKERRLNRQIWDALQPHLRSGRQEDTPPRGCAQCRADSHADPAETARQRHGSPIADCSQKAQVWGPERAARLADWMAVSTTAESMREDSREPAVMNATRTSGQPTQSLVPMVGLLYLTTRRVEFPARQPPVARMPTGLVRSASVSRPDGWLPGWGRSTPRQHGCVRVQENNR